MDIISRAMRKGLHLCENIAAEEQTWERFLEVSEKKKVFIFGAGGGTGYFLRNCCSDIKIFSVVDNDKDMQNQKLGLCCADAWHTEYADMIIQNPDALNDYDWQDVVVLITSTNYYWPIAKQLEHMGIDNYYVLLLLEANKRKRQKDIIEEDFNKIQNEYVEWCCHQEIADNKIVMLIGVYGEHARQITKALLKMKSALDIVWVMDNLNEVQPEGVRKIYWKNWKSYIYEMETAKIWIYDDLVPKIIRKRETQIYIQVKHWSSITLKKFYLDDKANYNSEEVMKTIKCDGERMDYLFSGSKFDEDSCKSGFMFKGKTVRIGSPRSDILFDRSIRKKVLSNIGINENARICLYVPTYRLEECEKTSSMTILLDMNILLKALNDKWVGEWFLLVRLHPSLKIGENKLPPNIHIKNVGTYPNSEELVAASDVLITDYSSIMFEQAYRKLPIFLYAPDRWEYIDVERGLLIDYEKLPFPIAESNEELHQCIKSFEQKAYEKKVTDFLDFYGVHEDGHASERAAKFIISLLKNTNI